MDGIECCTVAYRRYDPRMRAGSIYGLAIETSSALGSVALGQDDRILAARTLSGPRRHASEFVSTLAALCAAQEVRAVGLHEVYVSAGPGSFTGLRLGITVARMLAFAGDARMVAVPTLEVIAQNAMGADPVPAQVVVVLDAKRSRIFGGLFQRNGMVYEAVAEPAEVEPYTYLSAQAPGCAVLGEGVAYHRPAVERSGLRILPESLWPPRVDVLYRLGHAKARAGQFEQPRSLIPVYIRPPEAEEKFALRRSPK